MADKRIRKKRPVGRDRVIFDILSHIILLILSALCLLPFLLVLSGSFSRQEDILTKGYQLIPVLVTIDAYKMAVPIPEELIRALRSDYSGYGSGNDIWVVVHQYGSLCYFK